MRAKIEIRWFKSCLTMAQVRNMYRELSMLHHPDRGGNVRIMQEINAEYDELKRNPSLLGAHNSEPRDSGPRVRTWDDFRPYETIRDGCYKVKVVDVRESYQKKYVALVFDIAEGEFKDYYRYHPWHKHCIYLKYDKDWQLAKTRSIISKFNKSNKWFDGDYSFCNDRASDFVGKVVGINLSREFIDEGGFINEKDVFAV